MIIELDEKGFVFLDDAKRTYQCRMIEGQPWLLYWNEMYKCFTTLRPVSQLEIMLFPHNLSKHEQEFYTNHKKWIHDCAVEDSCNDNGLIRSAAEDYLKQEDDHGE